MQELDDLDVAVAMLNEATAALERARTTRDTALRHAFAAGVPIPALAERCDLGRSRVQQILGHPYGKVGRPPAGSQ